MEKRSSHPEKFKLNLKDLPPINPNSFAPPANRQVKYDKPSDRVVGGVAKPKLYQQLNVLESDVAQNLEVGDDSSCLTKYIDPKSTSSSNSNSTNIITKNSETSKGNRICQTDSKIEDVPNKKLAKSNLFEICNANHWKSPLFECSKEEGPCHMKLFTFKVTLVVESSNTILECFGAPQSTKKAAAEHAAEGALWYLKHLGYFPIFKGKKKHSNQ